MRGRASGTVEKVIFDFRYKDAQGKWKALGHRKGATRDAAFASLEERAGRSCATEYMSRPRDGRTRKWDLFRHPAPPTLSGSQPANGNHDTGNDL